MQTTLAEGLAGTPAGRVAERVLRACVHCGFCNATCPTYHLLGDELDGPRGRIYLMKGVLEGRAPTRATQRHLDRCLTCRACESTCPSGVEYGRLIDIGRARVDAQVPRPLPERLVRALLRTFLSGPAFVPAVRLAQRLRPLLPAGLRARVPARERPRAPAPRPAGAHARRVLVPAGCVQRALLPGLAAATARLLDRCGLEVLPVPRGEGCCGAVRQHLSDPEGARDAARRNIDAWWPAVDAGLVAIVSNASACGLALKEYGQLLADDPRYAARAARVSALARDVVELVAEEGGALRARPGLAAERVVFHPPCTLEHGQRLAGRVERLLAAHGAELLPLPLRQPCCGSAGTYALLERELAGRLRTEKLALLEAGAPGVILSANVGCISHLAAGTRVPVRHWIEWLEERLA